MKSTDTLADQLKNHYGEISLPPSAVQRILGRGRKPGRVRMLAIAAIAAAITVVAVSLMAIQDAMRGRVAKDAFAEVAMHHGMELDSDISSADWVTVESGLDKLDFPLRPLPRELEGIELVGARYCSVLGQPAAQLKVVRGMSEGTLYIVPRTGKLERIPSGVQMVDGIRVECWRTPDDRLYLLAENGEGKKTRPRGPSQHRL